MEINGQLTTEDIERILFGNEKITLAPSVTERMRGCYEYLKDRAATRVIYGINTGFGPMAQYRVEDAFLRDLQYNIIRSHATGAGNPIDDRCVRAALLARLMTFVQGKSGVHPDLAQLVAEFINREIYPYIPEHGSVGASGDLVQLAHIALTLIGEGKVHHRGTWRAAREVMEAEGLKPFEIHIREGLSITNGTSVMTGIGLVNLAYARRLLQHSLVASVMMNEIASSYDDLMNDALNRTKRHAGQVDIARRMRDIARGSKRLLKREDVLYNSSHAETHVFKHKVQPYYSLRCVPQILGPIAETLDGAQRILTEEINSACDNPIVDPETDNIYHGGNFHGDYVSLEMDKVKIGITKLAMLAERQLNYLFHDRINGILPPFVNAGVLGLNYGLQASQFTATSTTAECQTLAMSMYVHSIPNNNDNQDIVSMGTNAALLCKKVVDNAYQVMAIQFMALVQAVDILKAADDLAPQTQKVYEDVRKIFPYFTDDTPRYEVIAEVEQYLRTH